MSMRLDSLEGQVALVSGASGYVGQRLVSELLDSGFKVHACVRDATNEVKNVNLIALQKEKGEDNLRLFSCDVTKAGSFDDAIKGVTYVWHLAATVHLNPSEDPEDEFMKPAIFGTTNLLQAAKKAGSVKHVCLLSSTAAIAVCPREENKKHNEDSWSDVPIEQMPYVYSKKMQEEEFYKFRDDEKPGFRMSSLCPPMIFGPSIGKPLASASVSFLQGIFSEKLEHDLCIGVVDIRDVVGGLIHINIIEACEGRYVCSTTDSSTNGTIKALNEVCGLTLKLVEGPEVPLMPYYDSSKLLASGYQWRYDLKQTMKDSYTWLS